MGGGHTHSHTDYPQLNFSPGAKWIKNLTNDRTGNFSGGHYQDVNLSSVLYTHRLDDVDHIQLQRWSAPGITKPSFKEALKQDFQPAKKGESIGPSCKRAQFIALFLMRLTTIFIPNRGTFLSLAVMGVCILTRLSVVEPLVQDHGAHPT
jgi:hypothetical protein